MFCIRRFSSIVRKNNFVSFAGHRKCHGSKILTDESIWASNRDPKYTEVEEVKGHWHYVERLFMNKVAAEVSSKDSDAGWKTPSETVPKLPYYIQRTRNHMLPVYKYVEPEGPCYVSVLKRIQGDIWALREDLIPYLQVGYKKPLVTSVDEIIGVIKIRGNFEEEIRKWLYEKGF